MKLDIRDTSPLERVASTVSPHGSSSTPIEVSTAGGEPRVFDGTLGFLHPAAAGRGVLICGAVAYEALCTHKALRLLAGMIAGRGVPCLRFDYPGEGDALGSEADPHRVEHWRRAIQSAAALLRAETGATRLTLVGFGVGGLLAASVAHHLDGLTDLVLIAPPASGREFVRSNRVWGRMMREYLAIAPEPDADPASVDLAGFRIAAETASDLDLLRYPSHWPETLVRAIVLDRPNADVGRRLRPTFGTATVVTTAFDAYADLTTDPTAARAPLAEFAELAEWIVAAEHHGPVAVDHPAAASAGPVAVPLVAAPLRLVGDAFVETVERFGTDDRMVGITCAPKDVLPRAAVVFVNPGRTPRPGWGRSTTAAARALAARGIASLRFDLPGVGDAPEVHLGEFLYGPAVADHVRAAIDHLTARVAAPVLLAGSCSGAHSALVVAVGDARVAGAVIVNLQRLVVDPAESIEALLASNVRTVASVSGDLFRGSQWRRLVRGEIAVGRVAFGLLRRALEVLEAAAVRRGWPFSARAPLHAAVRAEFDTLARRGVAVAMLCAAEDTSRVELAKYFGRDVDVTARYPNVALTIVPGADHNFTPVHARQAFVTAIEETVGRILARLA